MTNKVENNLLERKKNPIFDISIDHYENLQDKLNQLKDAREALNALRSEYYERKQQEAFECERQRQIQLAQKLDLMRQKKQVDLYFLEISNYKKKSISRIILNINVN
jgi:hypothetical protein